MPCLTLHLSNAPVLGRCRVAATAARRPRVFVPLKTQAITRREVQTGTAALIGGMSVSMGAHATFQVSDLLLGRQLDS